MMLNRRSFLKSLGIAVIASTLPLSLAEQLSKSPVVKKRQLIKCRWSTELEQDLKAFHGIDAEKEIQIMIEEEMQKTIGNSKILSKKITCDMMPESLIPYKTMTVPFI